MKATYKTLPGLIASQTPFTHGSCSGELLEDGRYWVFSYQTKIATWVHGELVFFNEAQYSATTTRLQNIIKGVENENGH